MCYSNCCVRDEEDIGSDFVGEIGQIVAKTTNTVRKIEHTCKFICILYIFNIVIIYILYIHILNIIILYLI